MDKKCRQKVDKLLIEEVNEKRSIMKDTLELLKEEIEKLRAKNKQVA